MQLFQLQDAPADSFLALGDWLQQRLEIEVAAAHWDLNALPSMWYGD